MYRRTMMLLVLIGASTPPAWSQAFTHETFVGKIFLMRDYGQRSNVKVKKSDVQKYRGNCNRVVEVQDMKVDKSSLIFDLMQIGEVVPNSGGFTLCSDEFTERQRLTMTGLTGSETSDELVSTLRHLLLTPEAYLTSYGLVASPPMENPTTPLPRTLDATAKPILSINPFDLPVLQMHQPLRVAADFIVGRDGHVYDVKLTDGQGTKLGEAYLKILPLTRYNPALLEGQPVASRRGFALNYNSPRRP